MLLTVPETARVLGVCKRTVWNWIRSGRMPAVDVGVKKVRSSDLSLITGDQEDKILELAGKGGS